MYNNRGKSVSERGIALMFTAVSLVFIVPMVGLAVDAGILYTVKGKLQTAVDAAALAAAGALSRGNDSPTQEANAESEAIAYTNLNFPNGYFGVSAPYFGPGNGWVSVDESQANERVVKVTAQVTAPLYFLRWLNTSTTNVSATATAVRRDTNVILVVDRSGSLETSNSCGALRNDATAFINNFANGTDNVGLVTFGSGVSQDFDPATNFKTASTPATYYSSDIVCTGGTSTAAGLSVAYQQLVTLNQPNALNVVVLFTDGMPNAITANFPLLSSSTCTYKQPPASPVITGVLTPAGSYTVGLLRYIAPKDPLGPNLTTSYPNNDFYLAPNYSGCYYAQGYSGTPPPNYSTNVYKDVAYIPSTDIYGNAINTGYKPLTFSGGHIQLTQMGVTNATNAGFNAADSAALTIRQSTNIPNIRIFTIGLGNAPGGVDNDFLERVANDPRGSNYDSNYPSDTYEYAPTAADLSAAFNTIASEILHLSN